MNNNQKLSEEQNDAREALSGNLRKGHWLARLFSTFGITLEIGGVIYVIVGLFYLEWSKVIAGIIGGLFGLFLVYIGFLIQKRVSLKKLSK